MVPIVINTRADLDAIEGSTENAAFMAMLSGTLWRMEKDDAAGTWRAVEDDSTIERFGFTRADFPGVQPTDLPTYVPPPTEAFSCSPWQIRKALNAQGLRQVVETAIAASTDQGLKDGWEFATEFRSDDPFVISIGATLGMSATETAQFIKRASAL